MTIRLELDTEEAEWLASVLGLVMQLAQNWGERGSVTNNMGVRVTNRLGMARLQGEQDP